MSNTVTVTVRHINILTNAVIDTITSTQAIGSRYTASVADKTFDGKVYVWQQIRVNGAFRYPVNDGISITVSNYESSNRIDILMARQKTLSISYVDKANNIVGTQSVNILCKNWQAITLACSGYVIKGISSYSNVSIDSSCFDLYVNSRTVHATLNDDDTTSAITVLCYLATDTASITVRYINKDNEEIADSSTYTGTVGSSISVTLPQDIGEYYLANSTSQSFFVPINGATYNIPYTLSGIMNTDVVPCRIKFGDSENATYVYDNDENYAIDTVSISEACTTEQYIGIGSVYSPSCTVGMNLCPYPVVGTFFTVEFNRDANVASDKWENFGRFYINDKPEKSDDKVSFTGSGLFGLSRYNSQDGFCAVFDSGKYLDEIGADDEIEGYIFNTIPIPHKNAQYYLDKLYSKMSDSLCYSANDIEIDSAIDISETNNRFECVLYDDSNFTYMTNPDRIVPDNSEHVGQSGYTALGDITVTQDSQYNSFTVLDLISSCAAIMGANAVETGGKIKFIKACGKQANSSVVFTESDYAEDTAKIGDNLIRGAIKVTSPSSYYSFCKDEYTKGLSADKFTSYVKGKKDTFGRSQLVSMISLNGKSDITNTLYTPSNGGNYTFVYENNLVCATSWTDSQNTNLDSGFPEYYPCEAKFIGYHEELKCGNRINMSRHGEKISTIVAKVTYDWDGGFLTTIEAPAESSGLGDSGNTNVTSSTSSSVSSASSSSGGISSSEYRDVLEKITSLTERISDISLSKVSGAWINDGTIADTQLTTSLNNTITSASSNVSQALANAGLAQDTANNATTIANGKNKTYYASSAPTIGLVSGDLWFDTDDGYKMYRYSGSAWIPASFDSSALSTSLNNTISTASSNASTAISTASTANSTATTASNTASSALTTANTASTNASNAITTANSASTVANTASTNASTAVTNATTATTIANSKAKTFTSTPAPPYNIGDFYKSGQTVYICTTTRSSGSYTVSDWVLSGDVTSLNTSLDTSKVNGTASSTVISNITTAQNTASTAVTNAATAQTKADSAYTLAGAANTNASTAQSTADGKNTVYYSGTAPTGGTYKNNDIWFNTADGNKINYWNGTAWTLSQLGTNAIANLSITNALIADATIQNAKIANLDAGKLTTGYLSADRLASGSILIGKLANSTITGITDTVQIGGRNLLLNSSFDNGLSQWTSFANGGGTNSVVTGYNGHNAINISRSGYSGVVRTGVYQSISHNIVAGETCVISAWIKIDAALDANNNQIFLRGADGDAPIMIISSEQTGIWIKYTSSKFTVTASASRALYILLGKNGSINISNIKLEKGNKPTDYTVAPEDIDSAISTASIANWCYNNNLTYINGANIYTGTVSANAITANSITASQIASGAITTTLLASNCVTSDKIVSSAITTDKLAVNCVTANQIASGAITTDKLSANCITANKIDVTDLFTQNITATGTITGVNLIGGTISGGSITGVTLAGGTITGGTISGTTISGVSGEFTGAVSITGTTTNSRVQVTDGISYARSDYSKFIVMNDVAATTATRATMIGWDPPMLKYGIGDTKYTPSVYLWTGGVFEDAWNGVIGTHMTEIRATYVQSDDVRSKNYSLETIGASITDGTFAVNTTTVNTSYQITGFCHTVGSHNHVSFCGGCTASALTWTTVGTSSIKPSIMVYGIASCHVGVETLNYNVNARIDTNGTVQVRLNTAITSKYINLDIWW